MPPSPPAAHLPTAGQRRQLAQRGRMLTDDRPLDQPPSRWRWPPGARRRRVAPKVPPRPVDRVHHLGAAVTADGSRPRPWRSPPVGHDPHARGEPVAGAPEAVGPRRRRAGSVVRTSPGRRAIRLGTRPASRDGSTRRRRCSPPDARLQHGVSASVPSPKDTSRRPVNLGRRDRIRVCRHRLRSASGEQVRRGSRGRSHDPVRPVA